MALVSAYGRGVQMVANMKKHPRACRVAAVLVLLLVMLGFNVDLNAYLQRILSSNLVTDTPNFFNQSTSHQPRDRARELLDKLREKSLLAADGHNYTFTAAERREWHLQNPCQSRSELAPMYAARKYIRNMSPNTMWDNVLAEYANLHRICTKRVGNLTDHILSSNTTIPGCKFVIAEGVYGFGNRMLVTVSAMLYAIVSQRIILLPSRTSFRAVLCEPFEGSSWFLNDSTFPLPGFDKLDNPLWIAGPEFTEHLNQTLKLLEEQKSGDQSERKAGTSPPLGNAVVLSAKWGNWYPEKWFFCNTEQRYLSDVPWVFYSGCIYSIPDMYASAPFGATLQALFPDRMVITRLLRSAFFPHDSVWGKFKLVNRLYFQRADRRVSIQLRFFDDSHKTMSEEMTRRVMDCVLTNGILPKLSESTTDFAISPLPSAPITNVFIASLHSELHDHLREFYLRKPTISGEVVGMVQISSRQKQYEGTDLTDEDRQAFVEMLLLSFSDSLVVTPVSTFGQVGQAYGGLTPWILKVTSEDGPVCQRGQTVDPCQQNGYPGYACANDPDSPPDWSGLLDFCLHIDTGNQIAYGVQILDNHLGWQEAHPHLES